jgi:DnaJ domain
MSSRSLLFRLCVLLVVFSAILFQGGNATFKNSGKEEPDESDGAEVDDYGMYALMDRLTASTGETTFYGLLGVPEDADRVTIGAAFRKKSRDWHPDRHFGASASEREALMEKTAVLSQVAGILRHPKQRARYDWLLNDAPAWHRSAYLVRRLCLTAKWTIWEVIFLGIIFITLFQILSQVARRIEHAIRRWHARRTLAALNKSETKRLERKLDKGFIAFDFF